MTEEKTTTGEFEREPVPESALLGQSKFWGMYAGEHAAGTEFMIGPLFLAAGASLQDLILGFVTWATSLAVLTWRFLVTPIADRQANDPVLPARTDCRWFARQIFTMW